MTVKKDASNNLINEVKDQNHMNVEFYLKAVMDNNPFPISVVDMDDENIFYWSKSAQKAFGHAPKSTSEWYQLAYPDPQYRHDVIKRWKPYLEIAQKTTEAVNTGEYRITCKDGSVKICELYAQIIPGYLIVTLNDITERKQKEQILENREKLLKTTGRMAKVGGWELDVKTKSLMWSEETYRIHEVPLNHKPPLKDAIEFFHPDDRPRLKKAIKNAIEKAEPYDLEIRLITTQGKQKFTRTLCEPLIENDKVIKLIGTFQDITALKKAEEERRKSDERFRIAQEMSPDGFTILRPVRNDRDRVIDFVWVYENQSIAKLNGTDPQTIVGKRLLDLFPGHKDSQFLKAYKHVAETRESTTFEEEYSGETMSRSTWFRIVVVPMAENIAVLAQDITDRKIAENKLKALNQQLIANEQQLRAANQQLIANEQQLRAANQQLMASEQELRANEEKLRSIFENSTNLFYSHTPEHLLTYVSPQIADVLGYTPEEAMIKWTDLASDNPINEIGFQSTMKAVKTGERQPTYNLELIKKTGEKIWVEARESPVIENGKVTAIVGSITDITKRKDAEQKLIEKNEALLKSQYYLSKAQEIAGLGSWELDLLTNVLVWTDQNYYNFGLEIGTPLTYEIFLNCIHPEDRDYVNTEWIAAINGKPYDIEHRVIAKGRVKWLREKAYITFNEEGRAISAIGFTQDITDLKQIVLKLEANNRELIKAKESVDENRTLLKTIIDATPDLVWLKDINGRYLNCNKRFEDFFGKHESDIIGKTDYDFVTKELADFFSHHDKLAMKSLKPSINEEEITFASDGHSEILETIKIPITNKNKDIIGILGVGRDITDRKIAEKKLQERNDYIETILENMPIGFALNTISDGDVKYMNQKFEEIYGWSRDILTNVSIFFEKVFPDAEYRNKMQTQIIADIQSGDPNRMQWDDLKIVTSTNEVRYVIAFNIPLLEQDLMISTVQDITKRKMSEDELIKSKKKAEESDILKSTFLANMSHEIRTPMNGILGFTSLLQKPDLTSETRDQYIQIIKKSGARMLNTVNDLITVSKIETGQEELNNEAANPCLIIQEIFEFFKPSAESKGLKLEFEHLCSNKHDLIYLDTTKFTSIAHNLIKNAIKFTNKGNISIASKKDVKNLTISVKDTGIGIPKDRQDAIFDRFIQADPGDKNAMEGSGLGLSIVKAYVEMMGGTIRLESEPGKGSCFTIQIPIKKINKETELLPKKVLEGSEIKLNKIIIAEDDDISYQHLAISLKPYVKQTLHAVNGEEAVQMAKDNDDCDLILMDIKMPTMDGLEASKKIREFNKSVTIISQTAYALSEDKEKSLAAGCNGYISKPIDIQELLCLIEKET
jgi:PAS domain S-box-containing protein